MATLNDSFAIQREIDDIICTKANMVDVQQASVFVGRDADKTQEKIL